MDRDWWKRKTFILLVDWSIKFCGCDERGCEKFDIENSCPSGDRKKNYHTMFHELEYFKKN